MILKANVNGKPVNEDGTPYIQVTKFGSHCDEEGFKFWESQEELDIFMEENGLNEIIR